MSFLELLLLAIVLLVGVPAATRNATAAALVMSYLAAQGFWALTGQSFDSMFSLLVDLTVIAVIYCKAPVHYIPYTGLGNQFSALWWERSLWDRLVIAIFPAMWAVYFLPLAPYYSWLSLFWLAIAQFLAAAAEAFQSHLSSRSAKADRAPDTGSQFNAGWRERSYG